MQNHPMVSLPVADEGQWHLIELIDQLRICLGGLRSKTQGFRTAPESKQCGPIKGCAHHVTHMVQTPVAAVACSHCGHTGGTTILFVQLSHAGIGAAAARDNTPHLLDQGFEMVCDRAKILTPSGHSNAAEIRQLNR